MVTGVGIFVSGVLLSLGVQQGKLIDAATMHSIALPYVALIVVLYGLSVMFLRGFSLTRAKHNENIEAIGKA